VVQWSQKDLNIVPTPTLIKEMSAALEVWLSDRDSILGFTAGLASTITVEGEGE
jgi:hypothetical protein